jgi:hypothetical protein
VSREKPDSQSGGLQVQTLLLSALSAVAAATIVPLFWARGTVIATAMTPVVVALVTEALRRPVERAKAVAPRVSRPGAAGTAARRFEPSSARARRSEGVAARERAGFEPLPPGERATAGRAAAEDPFGLRAPVRRRSWWKLGLITGVLAFLLAAAVVTASELTVFGGSVSGERGRTTLFGGAQPKTAQPRDGAKRPPAPTAQASPTPGPTSTPSATASPAATTTPAPTATSAPPQGAAPQPTATP